MEREPQRKDAELLTYMMRQSRPSRGCIIMHAKAPCRLPLEMSFADIELRVAAHMADHMVTVFNDHPTKTGRLSLTRPRHGEDIKSILNYFIQSENSHMHSTEVKFKKNRRTIVVDALHAKREDRTYTVTTPRNELGIAEYRAARFGGM